MAKRKIQPYLTDETFGVLLLLKAYRRKNTSDIVEDAIREYAEKHCPDVIRQAAAM